MGESGHRLGGAPIIVLATTGTLGDLWPILDLGEALIRRGARVRLCAPGSFLPHARKLGMETWDCRPPVDAERVRRAAHSWDHRDPAETGRLFWGRPSVMDLEGRYHDLMAAARDADFFIYATTQFLGKLVAEKTGIPSLAVAIAPPHVARRPENVDGPQTFPRQSPGNRPPPVDGEPLVHVLDHIREFRGSIGLPEGPDDLLPPGASPIVAAISSHFCDPDIEKFPNIDFTGFWFHERPEWRDWRPDPALERFVEKGHPPLVLTFSSLPLRDARSVLRIHARTALLLSRRLVVLSGWAGFQKEDVPRECRKRVHVTGELPHEWLFARSAAVIHHGGIGTLAQAVRCGKPMLIEPYGNDQFFNAGRAVKLGIGAAAHPRGMTPEALAELLENKVLSPETCRRVRTLAEDMSTDPGVEHAADLIMARLRSAVSSCQRSESLQENPTTSGAKIEGPGRMKTVLLTWELGAGFGHVGPLLSVARELRRHGHRPVFALRDVVGPRPLLEDEDIPVLQAPRWTKGAVVRGRPFRPSSYSDILAALGFSGAADLAALVRSWDALIGLVKPDLIIADHSPTVCLAAYGTIPVAVVGNGYTVPPAHAAIFPPLYADRPPLMSEARLLENVRAVQRRRGRPAPPTLPALFDAPLRAVATFPELDPYRETRREPVLGPIGTMPPHRPLPLDGRLFAYLGEEHPALETIVELLAEHKAPVEAYLRGEVGSLRRLLAARGARVHESPPALCEVVPRAAAVVSHAGSTTAHAAMIGGRPQVLLPTHVEADLTAKALESLGVGVRLPRDAKKDEIAKAIDRASSGGALAKSATTLAAKLALLPPPDALAAATNACLQLLV